MSKTPESLEISEESVKTLDEWNIDLYLEQKFAPFIDASTIQTIKASLLEEDDRDYVGFMNLSASKTIFIGKEPWPDDVLLYQPYETEQILLPDMANCLAVQTYLKMCDLNFAVEYKANAEDMSPSGKVPFIKCGACLVSELEPIINFVSSKGYSLTDELDAVQKSDMRAYMSLVNTVLGNAENYITWVEPDTYSNVTKPRYGCVYPFPLNHVLPYLKRKKSIKRLNAFGWYTKCLDKVYEEVDRACRALSERLGKQTFFFGDKPTELDAVIFAHMYSCLTYPGSYSGLRLAQTLKQHPLLLGHCKLVVSILGYSENIEKIMLHKHCQKSKPMNRESGSAEINEFVFGDSEDEDDSLSKGYMQVSQDYSCVVNDPNPIYESVFGTQLDLELGPL